MPNVQAEINFAREQFRWNEANLTMLLKGPTGAAAKDVVRRAIRVEAAAKENASHRPGPMVRTGRLRGSITWRLGVDEFGVYADVGTAVSYAPFVELGTSRAPAYPYLRPALEVARY